MDRNQKNFNIYVFLSTFSRNLIEVFIPIILFKQGFSLSNVILYYLFVNFFSLFLTYPCLLFAKKYDYKVLSLIGVFSFIIMQILLNNIINSFIYLIILAFIFALYRRGYWFSRRYFNLKVIYKENITNTYTFISIINQIGVITSAYIGSLLLDYININILTIISITLFFISIIPLYYMKFEKEKLNIKIDLIKTIKKISLRNIYLFGSYELLNVVKFLFPLYLFIYIKDNYSTVGILNLFTNLATILFAYLYGKKINGGRNYLNVCVVLVTLVYVFKLNCQSILLPLIAFLEGIVMKMYEISVSKEYYTLSKKFEYQNYNLAYEVTQNLFRTIVVLLIYLFINDLKVMIYFTLIFILIGVFIKFKNIED